MIFVKKNRKKRIDFAAIMNAYNINYKFQTFKTQVNIGISAVLTNICQYSFIFGFAISAFFETALITVLLHNCRLCIEKQYDGLRRLIIITLRNNKKIIDKRYSVCHLLLIPNILI